MEVSMYRVLLVSISIGYNVYAAAPSNFLYSHDNYVPDNIENLTAIANTTLVLICPKSSDGIQWMITTDGDKSGQTLEIHSDTYELRPVTPQDKGVYTCLENGTSVIKKYNLTVLEPPYFIKKMAKFVVKPAGNMVKLSCKAGGSPTPNITWYRDSKTPPTRELGDVITRRWYLLLEDAVTADKGNYTCVVCNVVGCINFTYFVDVVERYPSKPHIKEGYPKNLTVVENGTATFECPQVMTDLEPYIQWARLGGNWDRDEALFNPNLQRRHGGTLDPEILKIVNVTHEDEGWYACFASNSLGTTMSKAHLQVIDEEPGTQ